MWKAEKTAGESLGGGKHKWLPGSSPAVARWILHTGAAVVRSVLGRIQEGGWDLLKLQPLGVGSIKGLGVLPRQHV